MRYRMIVVTGLFAWLPFLAYAQQPKQAKAKAAEIKPPDGAARVVIDEKLGTLRKAIDGLRAKSKDDDLIAEVAIFAKAGEWVTRHNEFFGDTAKWTLAVLDDGLKRAEVATEAQVAPWRMTTGKSVVRAYRSKIDGSVQPYAITAPVAYGKDVSKKWRLDVVLHGRDATLTEVKFLNSYRAKSVPVEQDFVQLDVYGRGNNAYRWAGEADVFEAVDAFLRDERKAGRDLIDQQRVVLRGFSMGGAGTWHLGLHYPSRWAAIGPGAGFSTTKGYTRLPDPLPDYIDRCLRIYDAVDYAENAAMVPVVAYAGANDPQLQAARNIEARLKPLGIPMTLLIAPNTEHRMTPEYAKLAEAEYAKYAGPGKRRPECPDSVAFVTHTLKFHQCEWVDVFGLDRHYDAARLTASRTEAAVKVATTNIRRLAINLPANPPGRLRIEIDGQVLNWEVGVTGDGKPTIPSLTKAAGRWSWLTEPIRQLEKKPHLQGPIDDAFTDAFLCVRGTGRPWHETTGRSADADLRRFQNEWDKYLRGHLPIKDDSAVTEQDIRERNLILFGDPASNSLIARVLPKLPITWTQDNVTIGSASGPSNAHIPVLIYPNPLNERTYVVLNSGHTFHADAFQGTNALLYPRLGDFALLQMAPTEKDPLATRVATAGLFDEFWQLPK